jgi:uncharacterized Zn finger protein (UPF0148 family)
MIENKIHLPRQRRAIPAPPIGHRNSCPYCNSPSFKAPGPCPKCGTTGYFTGESPAYRRRRRVEDHQEEIDQDQDQDAEEEEQ